MFTHEQKKQLNKHLYIDKYTIKRRFLKRIRKNRSNFQIIDLKPSWNTHTKNVDEELMKICEWTAIEDEECECKTCDEERVEMEKDYSNFKNELFDISDTQELHDFMIIHRNIITSLLETKLLIIRTELLLKKWGTSSKCLIAASKFKSKFKSK